MSKEMWALKYRPKWSKDYIVQNQEHRDLIEKWITEKSIPHLLLAGHRGTGKTSLAYVLANELNIDKFDFMKINASDDNSVDTVRTRIKSFISGMAISSDFKIVLLDEFDYFSLNGQHILRTMMEEYADNVRFILTCNKPQKIIPEIHSRCQEMAFSAPNKQDMTIRLVEILAAENVKGVRLPLVHDYVEACYPDFRKLLITVQNSVKDGTLVPLENVVSDTTEFMVRVVEFIESNDWHAARDYLAKNIQDDQWDECYSFLHMYLKDIGKFSKDINKWCEGILVIAEHQRYHAAVADPEINFTACLIKLSRI